MAFKELLITSIKRYFRNKSAVFWSIVFPLLFITIFGLMNFGAMEDMKLGIVDLAGDELSQSMVERLSKLEQIEVEQGNMSDLEELLTSGEIDVLMTIPVDLSIPSPTPLKLQYSEERAQQAGLIQLIVQQTIDQVTFQSVGLQPMLTMQVEIVDANNLDYIDFLIPGMISFSIMQLGITSVAFAFVDLKKRGVLRRLLVTPINPMYFIVAEAISRLMMLFLQVTILFGVGILFFDLTVLGSFWQILAVAAIGGLMFLFFGFAIAGYAKDSRDVHPLANLVTMPMMLLSGVFFPTEGFPKIIQVFANYLPLTYLADALREIANNGLSIFEITGELFGLGVWAVVGLILAVLLFRWE